MGRAILIIGAGAALIGIIIYALIDCARTSPTQVRSLPKPAWLAIILLFPVIGALLWLFVGRPRTSGRGLSSSKGAPGAQASKAPDDDEEYLRFLDAKAKRQRASEQNQRIEKHDPKAQENSPKNSSLPQNRNKPPHAPGSGTSPSADEDPADNPDANNQAS